MRYITFVLCVLMSVNMEALANKKCTDCMNIMKCDLALKSVDDVQKIREAFCGFNDLGTMVCCSYFSNDKEIEIENHPNINLLPKDCGEIKIVRIVGGIGEVNLYEFPWNALISYQTRTGIAFNCAGSVINSRYILTVANCIKDKNIIGVRIGEFNLTSEVDCDAQHSSNICESHIQDIRVEEKIYHEKYEGHPNYNYNIGLLRLQSPIDFSYQNAAPICLPTTKELYNNSIANKLATVIGWGLSDPKHVHSVPGKRLVQIYPDDECRRLNKVSPERGANSGFDKYCCRTDDDSCIIDSGTPLLIEGMLNNKLKYIQYGTMFLGPKDCTSKAPTTYTALSPYMTWILDHIKE